MVIIPSVREPFVQAVYGKHKRPFLLGSAYAWTSVDLMSLIKQESHLQFQPAKHWHAVQATAVNRFECKAWS